MGRKIKINDHSERIYIRIIDEDKWAMIEKLMALPKYSTSRTSLINNALDYGLPKLIEKEFGEITLGEEPDKQPTVQSVACFQENNFSEERMSLIIRLLQEIVMNSNIGKSLLCSLFNEKSEELKGTKLADKFRSGGFRDTPDYMVRYEIETLNEMDEEE